MKSWKYCCASYHVLLPTVAKYNIKSATMLRGLEAYTDIAFGHDCFLAIGLLLSVIILPCWPTSPQVRRRASALLSAMV